MGVTKAGRIRGDPAGVLVGTHFSCGEVAPNITEVPAGVACGGPKEQGPSKALFSLGWVPSNFHRDPCCLCGGSV